MIKILTLQNEKCMTRENIAVQDSILVGCVLTACQPYPIVWQVHGVSTHPLLSHVQGASTHPWCPFTLWVPTPDVPCLGMSTPWTYPLPDILTPPPPPPPTKRHLVPEIPTPCGQIVTCENIFSQLLLHWTSANITVIILVYPVDVQAMC